MPSPPIPLLFFSPEITWSKPRFLPHAGRIFFQLLHVPVLTRCPPANQRWGIAQRNISGSLIKSAVHGQAASSRPCLFASLRLSSRSSKKQPILAAAPKHRVFQNVTLRTKNKQRQVGTGKLTMFWENADLVLFLFLHISTASRIPSLQRPGAVLGEDLRIYLRAKKKKKKASW